MWQICRQHAFIYSWKEPNNKEGRSSDHHHHENKLGPCACKFPALDCYLGASLSVIYRRFPTDSFAYYNGSFALSVNVYWSCGGGGGL